MRLSALILIGFLLGLTCSAFGQENIQSLPLEANSKAEASSSKVVREVFDAAKYPGLAAVGRINFIGQSWCSIILVADDIAVSAGHCFLNANYKFNLKKDFEPYFTSVIFKPDGEHQIEGVHVKRVLTARMNPDYAIVKLDTRIPESEIKPLKISRLTYDEMRTREMQLGCAGFNGDKELGGGGFLMTISRNIKLVPETSSKRRVDTSCFSTYGGSGGLFFSESVNIETKINEYDFLGVIWGLTDEKINEKGEWVKTENVVTSITPVSAFFDELTKVLMKIEEVKEWQKQN